jgi:hypothetical protein
LKKVLGDCAKNPKIPPYNVVAETASPAYLIDHTVIELTTLRSQGDPVNHEYAVKTLEATICNLGLALHKLTNG